MITILNKWRFEVSSSKTEDLMSAQRIHLLEHMFQMTAAAPQTHTAFTLSGDLAVSFLPELGVSTSCWGCLLIQWLEICVPDDKFGFSGDSCWRWTSCKILFAPFWMILSPNKSWRKICFPLLSKAFWLIIISCYGLLSSNLKKIEQEH